MCLKNILYIMLLVYGCAAFAQDDDEEDNRSNKRPSWSSGLPERQSTTDLNKPDFKPDMDDEIEIDMSEFGIKPKAEIEMNLPIDEQLPDAPVVDAEDVVEPEPAAIEEPVIEEVVEVEEQPVADEVKAEEELIQPEKPAILSEPVLTDEEPVAEEVAQEKGSEPKDLVAEEQAVDEAVDNSVEPLEQVNNNQSPVTEQSSGDVESEEVVEYNWAIVDQKPVDYPPRAALENLEGWVDIEVTINPAGEVMSASPVEYSRKGRVFGKPAVQSINGWLFEPPINSGINTPQTRIYRVEFNL